MFLTYILLGLTIIAALLLALVHSLVVKEVSTVPIVKGSATCLDIDCVFKHVEQLLRQVVCQGGVPRAKGLCHITPLHDNLFLICCEEVCRIVEVKCD